MSLDHLRNAYGRNRKARQLVNAAIRAEIPGGDAALDLLTLLHNLQRTEPSGRHQEALELAIQSTDAMAEEIAAKYQLGQFRPMPVGQKST